MTQRKLTDLADVLRAAGCTVVELSGWQTRGRSNNSGYESGRPWCVMWHHTASAGDGATDADYCTFRSPDRPVANLVIGRDGIVYVCAAGPTNTNGKGGPLPFSRGTVPVDDMNRHAIGIEISNNGVGMAYPEVQINACFAASTAMCRAYGLKPSDVAGHWDWSPGRKIDPATAAAVQGPWRPRSVSSSGTWSVDDLRAECVRRSSSTPEPPQPIKRGPRDMYSIFVNRQGWPGPVRLSCSNSSTRWVMDGNTAAADDDVLVPRIERSKDQLLGILRDRPGEGPHPFGSGDWADADLAAAW